MKRPFYPLELEPCLGEVEWFDDEPTSPGFVPTFCGCPLCQETEQNRRFEGENQ